jgi:hypothetical protein
MDIKMVMKIDTDRDIGMDVVMDIEIHVPNRVAD